MGVLQRRVHANHLRICFAVDQAWKSIKRGTSYASTGVQGLSVFFVKQDAERQRERMMADTSQIVEQLLNARFVAHRRMTIGRAGRTFGRIDPVLPVDMIKMLRLGVVRLEVLIAQWPRRRDAAVVPDFSEVLLAESQQGRAINLGIPADVILNAGVKRLSVLVIPGLLGPILRFEEDGPGIPVVFLSGRYPPRSRSKIRFPDGAR